MDATDTPGGRGVSAYNVLTQPAPIIQPGAGIIPRAAPTIHSERRSQLAAGAGEASWTVSRVLLLYAATLAVASAGCLPIVDMLTYTFGGTAAAAVVCSALANVGAGAAPNKGEASYVRWMIGIHLGMILPPLLMVASVLEVGLSVPLGNLFRLVVFWLVIMSSMATLFGILVLRPSKEKQAGTGLV